MKKNKKNNIVIELIHILSDWLLDNPYAFNYVRYILAGKQTGMKHFIKNNLKKYNSKTVGDFCCGTGDFAQCCGRQMSYVGIDLNLSFINFALKRYKNDKNKNFIASDVLQLPYKGKTFDALLLISAIHHLSDKELSILLPVIKRITKKVVIIADIIPDPPHLLQRFFVKLDRGRHIRPEKEKVRILSQYFKVVHTEMIPTRSAIQCGIICEIK